eukprot:CAMPEP_0173387306 /NCGR_PEP_ID=MMETSP1356-20130122/9824_1 /TAXON_ID=77927 ORGANISM="Hemiselmis virescens, Strain PCC157" /NCGR_SAMPLE_ID=MMETSP1356 /ASSEMBLY_ACC=CAM_ASM_000847 /LENGTH=623 /DNA_ID=CAMNT_0014343863 /DNA_START=93 /DNA_END=1964 /DNA_ORIENTATION=-
MASFDAAEQERFVAAVLKASPSAIQVSIASVTQVSVGRRRLLSTFLELGVEALYADSAAAESAAANDLTEDSLNTQMQAQGLSLLTVAVQPTVSSKSQATAAVEAWVIAVGGVGGLLLLGVGALLLTRCKHIWSRPNVDAGEAANAPANISSRPVFNHDDGARPAAAPPSSTDLHLSTANEKLPSALLKVYEPAGDYYPHPKGGIQLQDVDLSAGLLPGLEDTDAHVGKTGAEQTTGAVGGTMTSLMCRQIPYAELLEATRSFDQSLKIGEGGFGSVFGCRWNRTPVAVKRLEQDEELAKANGMSTSEQLYNEVRVLSKFQHPNILQLLGFSNDGPTSCLVYPLASKGSLYSVLHPQSPAAELFACKARVCVLFDVVCGLAYLHGAGATHRDIKSANILVDRFNTARIGDFGLTRIRAKEQGSAMTTSLHTQNLVGTHVYMAPEVLRGSYSHKADVYALGVVVLELLTGLDPSPGEGRDDIVTYMEGAWEGRGWDHESGIEPHLASVWAEDDQWWRVMTGIAVSCLEKKGRRPKAEAVHEQLEQKCSDALKPQDPGTGPGKLSLVVEHVAECVICTEAAPVFAFVPCGHRCLCESCSNHFLGIQAVCPLCRTPATQLMKVFDD